MNPESRASATTNAQRQQRWGKLVFYLGLFLVVAWLYESQPADIRPAGKRPPLLPKSTKEDLPNQQNSPIDRDSSASHPRQDPDRSKRAENDDNTSQFAKPGDARNGGLIVRNARVTDENGDVIYRGDVDLQSTLDRIDRGKRLRFSHDGIVFENREHRLPQKPSGYYHEFVYPTPGYNGPGGQRVVLGREGEVYYSPDHYHTFRRVQ